MKRDELVGYYLNNRNEFTAEDGHEKLLVGLKKFMKPIETENKIVGIDVGCCVGEYIKHIYEVCMEQNKDILCFEPNPINNSILEQRIANIPFIHLFKYCVSNETTTASFYNWKDNQQNYIGNGVAGLRSGGTKICDTDVKKLDDVLDQFYGGQDIVIKFLKVDTEGNDTNVLKGFQKYLSKTRYIIFECSDCLDDMRGPGIKNPMKDVVEFLSANDFDTYRIGTKKLFKVNDEYWSQIYDDVKFWSNCFALRKGDTIINELVNERFDYLF
jgi:FkbM family methyltransferase